MSGIVGSKLNIRGSGLVGSLGTDGQHMLSAGPGKTNVFETAAGGGKIGQVLTAIQDAVQTVGSSSYVDIPGLTLAITPAATSSKILWNFSCFVSTTSYVYIKPVYGGGGDLTTQAIADADSAHQRSTTGNGSDPTAEKATCMSMMGLDSPATTSETTYKLQWVTDDSANQCYMNRMKTDTDNSNYGHSISSLTIMEVLA